MIVEELYGLTQWATAEIGPLLSHYENLATTLEHNTRNTQKVGVRDQLLPLEEALRRVPLQRLTAEQLELLDKNDMLRYLGTSGIDFLKVTVRDGNFDPATGASSVRGAHQALTQGLRRLETLREDMNSANVQVERKFSADAGVITRLHFQDRANIGDVAELKKWSSEWYDIARGLAAATKERPEDVRVIGASTGSLILVLSTSVAIATVLSILAKNANLISKSVLDILNGIEDLRHKKVLNQTIEDAMKEQAKAIKDNGVATAVDSVKAHLGVVIDKEVETLLNKAVEKYFNFTEKGGEVDMLAPPASDAKADKAISANIAELNASIEEVRAVKANLQQLLGTGDGGSVN